MALDPRFVDNKEVIHKASDHADGECVTVCDLNFLDMDSIGYYRETVDYWFDSRNDAMKCETCFPV